MVTCLLVLVCLQIKHATVPTWKKMHAHDESAAIISETSYHRHDDAQTAVDEAEVIMGYKYGTTLVPFSGRSYSYYLLCLFEHRESLT